MNPVKVHFSGMAVQIQGKITEQPDAESTVQIVLQHMVDLIKYIFCGRENGVGIAADGLMAMTGAVGRKNFVYDLVRAGVLVQPDHAVVEFQKEAPAGFGKTVLIGDVVIAELFLFQITMGRQNTLCLVKVLFVTDIEIEIAQLAVFRNRIAVGKAQSLQQIAGNMLLFQQRDGSARKMLDLVIIEHHTFCLLLQGYITVRPTQERQQKRCRAVFL